MKTIFKYQLTSHRNELAMPIGSQLLAVQMQDGMPCLWAIVDPTLASEQVHINLYGTGFRAPDSTAIYLATVQAGPYVWHAFREFS